MPGAIGQRLHRYLLDSCDENLKAQAATAPAACQSASTRRASSADYERPKTAPAAPTRARRSSNSGHPGPSSRPACLGIGQTLPAGRIRGA